MKDVIQWEGTNRDFPRGPLYWHDRGTHLELEAVGTLDKKKRREMICTVRKPVLDQIIDEKQNGGVATGLAPQPAQIRPELLNQPTEKEGITLATRITTVPPANKETAAGGTAPLQPVESEEKVVQAGEVLSASRPEPVSFVTAHESLNTLSEKVSPPTEDTSKVNGTASGTTPKEAAPRPQSSAGTEKTEDGKGMALRTYDSRTSVDTNKTKSTRSSTGSRLKKIMGGMARLKA